MLSMALLSTLFQSIILYNGGLESYVYFVFLNSGPPSPNPSHERQSVLLEEIVMEPARCETEPVNSSSDNSSNETVDSSTRQTGPSQPDIPPLPSAVIRETRVKSECGFPATDIVSTGRTRQPFPLLLSLRR